MHVVPEVPVREHVKEPRPRDAREQHREPEVDDHVGIQADAASPEHPERGREEEPGEEEDEVGRETYIEQAEQLRAHERPHTSRPGSSPLCWIEPSSVGSATPPHLTFKADR